MDIRSTFSRTLGPISAKFINELYRHGKTIFTLDEAEAIYAKSRLQTIKFIQKLIKRGILSKIKPGVYLILQMGQEASQLTQWPIIARELAGRQDYFLSHYSAMRLHGMTTHPQLTVYITILKRQKTKTIHNINYYFIRNKVEHFWGWTELWVSKQEKINVSDLERTLLDSLDRPELCGSIKEIINGIWIKHKDINWQRLIKHAKQFRTKAAVKRLGFILETLEIDSEFIKNIAKIIKTAEDYILLDPDGPKEGKYLRRWRIQININIEEIKASVWG